jgi:hypothetical protein
MAKNFFDFSVEDDDWWRILGSASRDIWNNWNKKHFNSCISNYVWQFFWFLATIFFRKS